MTYILFSLKCKCKNTEFDIKNVFKFDSEESVHGFKIELLKFFIT